MSNPVKYKTPWKIYKGYAFSRVLTYKNKETGLPIDITGVTVDFKAKPSVNYGSDLISLTIGSGITVDAVNGKITIRLTKIQTAAIVEDALIWVLALNDEPVMYGTFEISNEVG